jgi:hypothetical protein
MNHDLLNWWEDHHLMGGYVALCYVDWTVLHPPVDMLVDLLERYRQLDPGVVQSFIRDQVTNNEMPDREILEDGSKIFYLVQELDFDDLMFTPQIIHEPWYQRYRVHPGSGRAAALWLWGYERFKTVYTHFDEPGFHPPGVAMRIHSPEELFAKSVSRSSYFSSVDIQTYYAFPTEGFDKCTTKRMDSVWEPEHVTTLMPWKFFRYSEGNKFLYYKQDWRRTAWVLWTELQASSIMLGDTVFEFSDDGQVSAIVRKGQPINIDKNTGLL